MINTKHSVFIIVWITTFLLILLTALSFSKISFSWIFYLTIIGQALVVYMVYRVLIDQFTTNKTFDTHFYQDSDIRRDL
ncbi:MAG: hypothetical protein CSA39_05630 [Flavobacteriales bacterium]|nr:MAG: hypothetical protein CR989_02800 [Flavobacteriales bacterium]PIE48849.1 MAG: hypothetical protein CSA39_05630 [Flavobacteriales bacterium]